MKQNSLLVIIVSFNSMQWVKRCYDSIRASSVPCDVLTVDNGSTDGTQEYIRVNYPEVELKETGSNLGFGRANNIGLQKALDEGYDYVYLLNQDAWIKPDTFERLIAMSKKHPEYGILSPMQLQANEDHLDYNFMAGSLCSNNSHRPYIIEDMYFGRKRDVYEVDFVMAAHWLITRQCLETVGGFSPTFPHYGEDDNYIHRVKYWKMKVGIVSECHAIHDRADRKDSPEKALYFQHYIDKLKQFSNPLCTMPVMALVREGFRLSWKRRDKVLFKYTWRIYKERKQIEENLERSKKTCAFLNSL